jgi:hypothetical protein
LIVSHEHRFIFLKTRKTAGTSIELALSQVCGPDDVITPLAEADEIVRRELGGRGPQNHTKPTLRRNAHAHLPAIPVRKIVGPEVWDDYRKLTVERNPWDAVVSLYFWHYRDTPEPPSFEEFLQTPRIEALADKNAAIYRIDDVIVADAVLHQEDLAGGLTRWWTEAGLPGEPRLPHAKAGSRPRAASYREMYDDAGRDRVAAAFRLALADFDYRF